MPRLAEKVRARRVLLGLTQRELGDQCSVTASTISRIERGIVTDPPTWVIRNLAIALRTSDSFLLGVGGLQVSGMNNMIEDLEERVTALEDWKRKVQGHTPCA